MLDDLKKQAEARKLEEQSKQVEKNRSLQVVDAVLREIYRYTTELANSLNIVKPEVTRSLFVEGNVKLDNLRQSNYRVRERRKTLEQRDYLEEVSLRLSWIGREALVVERDSPTLIQRLRDRLGEYALRFECKETRNERGVVDRAVFTIDPEVLGAATFAGNWDTGKIRLTLKNIEALGVLDFQYDASEIDQGLLEELTKLVLGQASNLRNLGKHQEMLRTTPRARSLTTDVQYPPAWQPEVVEPDPKSGMLDSLKSLLKK